MIALAYLLFFLTTVTFSVIYTLLVRDLCVRRNWVTNHSNTRSIHSQPIPRLGGVAIFLAFNTGLLLLLIAYDQMGRNPAEFRHMLLKIMPAAVVVFTLGLLDDLIDLKAWVKFVVQNQMDQPFTLHFHGLTVPNSEDGVPYITQPPIMPGQYWTYNFTIKDPPGMYVYHSHFNSAEQVGKGLYGALNVVPKAGWKSVYGVEPQVEYSMFLGDGPLGYNLNGKSFPATQPIVAKQGQWVLIHMANDGSLLHPMHLHGYHFTVVGEDGFPLARANRYQADTLVVAPGSRFDILFKAVYPGAWAFHCHILPHAEGPDGMFGMVTAVVVQ